MKRTPPLSTTEIFARLIVDMDAWRCFWIDVAKQHRQLNGREAGGSRTSQSGKKYWVIRIDGVAYKRAHIILALSSGAWPTDMVDHIDGNSLNDAAGNLRHATATQNAWNHKSRKKASSTPMGVKLLKNGRYQARIACNKKQISLGTFDSADLASHAYQAARKEYFNDFC